MAAELFAEAFPEHEGGPAPAKASGRPWPVVPGEYFVNQQNPHCHIAVTTLASADLARQLAAGRPDHLCVVGKTETENIGVEKLVKNVISNPSIHFLVLAGKESKGHRSGATLLSLHEHGIDSSGRVRGPSGRDAVLPNTVGLEVEAFRRQVVILDMRGCADPAMIAREAAALVANRTFWCGTGGSAERAAPVPISGADTLRAAVPARAPVDPSGYFLVLPDRVRKTITVEFYSADHRLRHAIEDATARGLYLTAVANGCVDSPLRAACLGHEAGRAEAALTTGAPYAQESC